MEPAVIDSRERRGLELAQRVRVKRITESHWVVPSATSSKTYICDPVAQVCSCADHEARQKKCKHLYAVDAARRGTTPSEEPKLSAKIKRPTYARPWSRYNAAKENEKAEVSVLLRHLCNGVAQPTQHRGRHRLPLADVVFACVMRAYIGFSARRVTSDLRELERNGYVEHAPHWNSLLNYLKKPEVTPLLMQLVTESAAPLASMEEDFAIDSTGFSTSVYARWFDHKYGKEVRGYRWLKAHVTCGVRTNIISGVTITDEYGADGPELPGLVRRTAARFKCRSISCDKAYLSNENLEVIESVGAKAYIPFKSNSTERRGHNSERWNRLLHFFRFRNEEFQQAYGKRANVEGVFSGLKRVYSGRLRCRLAVPLRNELLCRIIAHNMGVLVRAIYELGAAPEFWAVPANAEVAT